MARLLRPAAAAILGLTLIAGAACSSTANPPAAPGDASASTGSSAQANPTAATTQPVSKSNALTTEALVKLAEPSVVRIQTNAGIGTGFVIDAGGYIMTNNHVIEGTNGRPATSIKVTMSDGGAFTATVVGTDVRSDLALIKIDTIGLTALKLANLDDIAVGQDVVAIGYALDLQGGEGPSYSVTRGIVSQKNRAIAENAAILGSIQTDAAINHGNSGGPLLDLFGEVVGINTSLAPDSNSASGVASGIGFAVGSDVVKAVFEQLKATGKVNRGFLGVQGFEALRPAQAKQMGLPDGTQGVVLAAANSVAAGGPAAAAGLQSGDVITKIGQYALRDESGLAIAMIKQAPGTKVSVEFYRGGKKQTADVTLGTPTG
jgi:S1-C subfamily serine protease